MKKKLFIFLLSVGMIFLNINFIAAETTDKIYWAVDGICEENGEDAKSDGKLCVLTLSNNSITGSKDSGSISIDDVFEYEDDSPWQQYLFNVTDIVVGGENDIIKPKSTAYWFGPQLYFVDTIDFTYLDTSEVTNMSHMFDNANGLVSLDLSNFDTSKVQSYEDMFFNLNPTIQIKVGNKWNLDLSDEYTWKALSDGRIYPIGGIVNNQEDTYTPQVIYWNLVGECNESMDDDDNCILTISNNFINNYSGKFNIDTKFDSFEDVPWKSYVEYITDIVVGDQNNIVKPYFTSYWFKGLSKINNFELPYLDTSNVTNMDYMFDSEFKYLDISNLNTLKVNSHNEIFSTSKTIIKVGNKWNLDLNDEYVWMDVSTGQAYSRGNIPSKQVATYKPLMFYWAVDGEDCEENTGNCTLTISNDEIDGNHYDDSLFIPSDAYYYEYLGDSWEKYHAGITNVIIGTGEDDIVIPSSTANWFSNFNRLESIDLTYLDTKYVMNMSNMFLNCKSLQTLDLSNFDTSNVINFASMFKDCISLLSLDLSNFDTSKVGANNFNLMFNNCASLETLDLSSFDTSNVVKEDSYIYDMFANCNNLTNLIIGKKWNAAMENNIAFKDNITEEIYVTYFKENTETSYSTIHNKYYWAIDGEDCNIYSSSCTLYISNNPITGTHFASGSSDEFNISNSFIKYTDSITNVVIGGSDDIIKPYSTVSWFSNFNKIKNLNLAYLDTSEVRNMSYMFYECSSLETINISNFNTSNAIYMFSMFEGCNSLKELNISKFNTSNVLDMHDMFNECKSLEKLDLSNFNTSNVKDMYGMFENCTSLKELNIGGFNTSKVVDMAYMFSGCTSLEKLDLNNFNTSSVTYMYGMFGGIKIPKLDLNNFDMSKLEDNNIFYDMNSETILTFKIGTSVNKIPKYNIYNSKGSLATGNMATGYYLLNNNGKKIYMSVNGDVNGDSKISISDVMKTSNYAINGTAGVENYYKQSADVNHDGKISISDVMKISNSVINGGNL